MSNRNLNNDKTTIAIGATRKGRKSKKVRLSLVKSESGKAGKRKAGKRKGSKRKTKALTALERGLKSAKSALERTRKKVFALGAVEGGGWQKGIGQLGLLGAGALAGSMVYAMADGYRSTLSDGLMASSWFPVGVTVGLGLLGVAVARYLKNMPTALVSAGIAVGAISQEAMKRFGSIALAWAANRAPAPAPQIAVSGDAPSYDPLAGTIGAVERISNDAAVAPILNAVLPQLPDGDDNMLLNGLLDAIEYDDGSVHLGALAIQ